MGHRLFRRRCLTAFRRGAFPPAPPEPVVAPPAWSALPRWNAIRAWCGIAVRSVLYLPLFLRGARTGTGAAALDGSLAADMATWVVFRAVEWHACGFQIGLGAAFETAIVPRPPRARGHLRNDA